MRAAVLITTTLLLALVTLGSPAHAGEAAPGSEGTVIGTVRKADVIVCLSHAQQGHSYRGMLDASRATKRFRTRLRWTDTVWSSWGDWSRRGSVQMIVFGFGTGRRTGSLTVQVKVKGGGRRTFSAAASSLAPCPT